MPGTPDASAASLAGGRSTIASWMVFLLCVASSTCALQKPETQIDSLIHSSLQEIQTTMDDFRAKQENDAPSVRQRPFVTVAYAQSIDGKIALLLEETDPNPETTRSSFTTSSNFAISGPESLRLTHALRSIHDVILVGGKTLAIDNPRLTNRTWKMAKNYLGKDEHQVSPERTGPRPVVLDTHLTYTKVLGDSMRAKNPIVCCSFEAYEQAIGDGSYKPNSMTDDANSIYVLKNNKNHDDNTMVIPNSVTLLPCKTASFEKNLTPGTDESPRKVILDLADVLYKLYEEFGIRSLMVEGGASVISQFITTSHRHHCSGNEDGLVDCLCVTISPKVLGTNGLDSISSSTRSVGRSLGPLRCISLGEDCVLFSNFQ